MVVSESFNKDEMRLFYEQLGHRGETEIRIIDPHDRKPPDSRFVCRLPDFIRNCCELNGEYNVYAGINERRGGGTRGADVLSVRLVYVDVDPRRESKTSASDEQRAAARVVADKIIFDFKDRGFSEPRLIDSGNGWQLVWAIPEINIRDDNRASVEASLQAFQKYLAEEYDTDLVKIDNIGDLPRIIKVPGTLNIKGPNDPKSPWRMARYVTKHELVPDIKLFTFIMTLPTSLNVQPKVIVKKVADVLDEDIELLCKQDLKLRRLMNGDSIGYDSRSEAEMALIVKLMLYGIPETRILVIMDRNPFGKWGGASKAYRERTMDKAREFVASKSEPSVNVKVEDVISCFKKWLYLEDADVVYLMLGLFISHHLKGDPVWMFLVAPSSDHKTEMLRAFNVKDTHLIQDLTEKSLISGYNPKDVDRSNYDLAPRLHNKILMIYDFSEILVKRGDERNAIFAQLRSLYDGMVHKTFGNGVTVTYGTGKPGDPKIYTSMVVASTPVVDRYLNEQNILGTRHLSYRHNTKDTRAIMFKIDELGDRSNMRDELQNTVSLYLNGLDVEEKELPVKLNKSLHDWTDFMTVMRAGVSVNSYTDEVDEIAYPEKPARAYLMLKKLAQALLNIRGLSLGDVIRILKKVIFSSIPQLRLDVLKYMLDNPNVTMTKYTVGKSLGIGERTAKRHLNTLTHLKFLQYNSQFDEVRRRDVENWVLPSPVYDNFGWVVNREDNSKLHDFTKRENYLSVLNFINENNGGIKLSEIVERFPRLDVDDIVNKLKIEGHVLEPREGLIKVV